MRWSSEPVGDYWVCVTNRRTSKDFFCGPYKSVEEQDAAFVWMDEHYMLTWWSILWYSARTNVIQYFCC